VRVSAAGRRFGRNGAAPARTEGAIVIGADYRGLGMVRSLGRHGIPVVVVQDGDDVLARCSRYAAEAFRLEGETDSQRVEFLLNLADEAQLEGWMLFPTGDETAALLARHQAALSERFALTTPPWEVLRWAYDKRLTYELAGEIGIPYPRTWYPTAAAEASGLGIAFPAIIKPAVKKDFNRLTLAKAWRVDNGTEFCHRLAEARALVDPELIMVQELVPGGGESQFSYAALCDAGEAVVSVVARRTRQYPMDFGRASTYVESVERREVVEPSVRLLRQIDFTGLVEIEYKQDPRDGQFKLLDMNPRAWGWHTLGRRAGIDFTYLAWRLSRGEHVPHLQGVPGLRWLRLSTDLPTSVREIATGKLSARDYVRSVRGPIESAIFATDDLLPGVLELPLLARLFVMRLARGDPV
jgi:D-aspartate ligase